MHSPSFPSHVFSSPSRPVSAADGSSSVRIRKAREPRSRQGQSLKEAILRSAETLTNLEDKIEESPSKKRNFRAMTSPRRVTENSEPSDRLPSTPTQHFAPAVTLSTPSSSNNKTAPQMPPPTPVKPKTSDSLNLTVLRQVQSQKLKIGEQEVFLTRIGSGSYMDAFLVDGIIQEKSKGQLVVKVYNENRCGKEAKSFLRDCMKTSLEAYREAKSVGIPVAKILNEETAQQEGYFLQEYISHPIDILDASHLEQARKIFLIFLQNKKLLLDLTPSNLRVNEKGQVILIDFVEEKDDEWFLFFKSAIQEWGKLYMEQTKNNPLAFLKTFTKDFYKLGYKPEWTQEIVTGLLPLLVNQVVETSTS